MKKACDVCSFALVGSCIMSYNVEVTRVKGGATLGLGTPLRLAAFFGGGCQNAKMDAIA
jgi:hypothetical protein